MFNQFFLFPFEAWLIWGGLIGLQSVFLLYRQRNTIFPLSLGGVLTILFLGFLGLSYLFSDYPLGQIELLVFGLGACFCLLLASDEVLKKKMGNWLVAITPALILLISVPAIVKFIPAAYPRLHGFFVGQEAYTTYPNTLAFVLLLLLPISYYALTKLKFGWQKWLALLAVVSGTVAFLLTFSRGGLIALVLAFLIGDVLLLFKARQQKQKLITVLKKHGLALFTLLLSLILAFSLNYWHGKLQPAELAAAVPLTVKPIERLADRSTDADQSTDERILFWQGSLALIKKSPWFGIGSDGFKEAYPQLQSQLLATSNHPHNLILKLAVENGLLAAGSFCLLILSTLYVSGKKLWSMPLNNNFYLKLGVFVALVAGLLHNLVDYNLGAAFPWFLALIILGLNTNSASLIKDNQRLGKIFSLAQKIVIVFSLLVISLLTILFIHSQLVTQRFTNMEQIELAGFSLIKPVYYQRIGELCQAGTLPKQELKPLVEDLVIAANKFPKFDDVFVTLGRCLVAQTDYPNAAKAYNQALRLNSLNDLTVHDEFIEVLEKLNYKDVLAELVEVYYNLLSAYELKLATNEHNTVASKNPQAAQAILEKLLKLDLASSDRESLLTLQKKLEFTYQKELKKFQQLFPE
jgi:O-antigen ligase